MTEALLSGRVVLHCGDCRSVLAELAPDSIDAVVTDPPYHLTSIVKRFGGSGAYGGRFKEENGGTGAAFARMSRGFMGKQWDGGDVAFDPETWRAVARVLKPGGHLVACGGTRTFHRLACAIEDAGFEIRDTISWLYGSGFPKSHDVSKGIDRAAGAQREVVGQQKLTGTARQSTSHNGHGAGAVNAADPRDYVETFKTITAPATDAARQWEGWGTALKPACELIVLARKPLSEGNVAANVLRWGTGALNIDGCRVGTDLIEGTRGAGGQHGTYSPINGGSYSHSGRWPANVAHDGSDEVTAAFPESNGQQYAVKGTETRSNQTVFGVMPDPTAFEPRNDTGSAARFFYTAKADADDRLGSKHPTVKPLDLMQWLVRLVTPKGGTVLDPFAGTGTTGEAAWREGAHAVLIEAESEYQADIRRRMALALAGPDERSRESVKAKNLPRDDGPLFSEWQKMWAKPFDFSQEPK